jgi:ribosome-binding factor A
MGLRQERLADEIRDVLASCFLGGQMQDPRLANVTVTAVKLTGDLQQATVYFRLYETDEGGVSKESKDKKIEEAMAGLQSASGYLRRRIGEAILLRRVPSVRFVFDESIAQGALIEKLLASID